MPASRYDSGLNSLARIQAVVALGSLLAVLVVVLALTTGSDDSGTVAKVVEAGPATASAEPTPVVSGNGFDLDECTEVMVKRIDTGEKVKKTVSFCEAQAKLATVDSEQYFAESPHYRSKHELGRVIKDGLKGLTPEEQLRKIFRLSAKHPSVAASVIGCYAPGAYTQEKLDRIATGKPGSPLHREAFVDLHDILTDEDTAFVDITLKDVQAYNEGRAPDGTRTSTPQSVSGDATQVTTGMNSLPSGGTTAPHDSMQLDKCDNCVTPTPAGGVVTEKVGVIPPTGEVGQPGHKPVSVTPPSGGEGVPGTVTIPSPPTSEKPKRDTSKNTPGPTGNGKPQPVSETEPPAAPSPSSNHPPAPGTTSPHPTPPVPPPPSPTVPPAEDGGSTPSPTDNW